MKYVFSFILLSLFFYADTIYSIPVNTIDDKPVDLHSYRGKKIMFITLSLTEKDENALAKELAETAKKYPDLIIVAVPEETGITETTKEKVRSFYKGQPSNFILTACMKVNKAAGENQSPLFQWLTDIKKNRHFDQDVTGAGHKFFVDESGVLYAVMGSNVKLSHPLIHKIISRATPK